MNSYQKTTCVVFLFLISALFVQAQYHFEKFPNGGIKKIIFENGKEFDMLTNNPFFKKRTPDTIAQTEIVYYNLTSSEVIDLCDTKNNVWFTGKEPSDEQIIYAKSIPKINWNETSLIISYSIRIQDQWDMPLAHKENTYILDTLGNVVHQLNFDTQISDIALTSDRKFFAVLKGGILNEYLINVVEPSFQFFNFENNSKIFQLQIPDSTYAIGVSSFNEYLIAKVRFPYKKQIKFYFFLSNSNELYSILINFDIYKRIIGFSHNGIILCKSLKDRSYDKELTFSKDFKKETMP